MWKDRLQYSTLSALSETSPLLLSPLDFVTCYGNTTVTIKAILRGLQDSLQKSP